LIVIAASFKWLVRETVMQWYFSFVTLLNIHAAIIFLSYVLCGLFSNPRYANAILRAVLFLPVIWVFWKKAGPIYRNVKEYWSVFSLLTVILLINYLYYFLSGDIQQMMSAHFIPILLLIFLTVFIYLGIFLSLEMIIQRYELREENIKNQNERILLEKTSAEMHQRLSLMNDAVKQMRVVQHDRRHFNATLKELIEQGETGKALLLIQKQTSALPQSPRFYCENVEVNAAVSYYAAMANQKGIICDIQINIPKELSVDRLELAMVVSNLMENAVQGVMNLTEEGKRKIRFIATYTGQLILEIENCFDGDVKTDKNGIPVAEEEGHGLGTQSVVSFAKKWNADLEYIISGDRFQVQLMI
jgi:hypothetical protein